MTVRSVYPVDAVVASVATDGVHGVGVHRWISYRVGPPVEASHMRDTEPAAAVASGCRGAVGGWPGATGAEAADDAEVPAVLLAVTWNVKLVPGESPANVACVAVPATVSVIPPGEAVTV